MSITLYGALVPSMLQMLGAARAWLDRPEVLDHDERALLETRLAPDMHPFAYQVRSIATHSKGAFEGAKSGVFAPDMSEPPQSLAGLREQLDSATRYMTALDEDEVEKLRGRDMRFEIGGHTMPFATEDFLLSMSQPNFYFHTTTSYAILRMLGVPVGKRDFMGQVRVKQS